MLFLKKDTYKEAKRLIHQSNLNVVAVTGPQRSGTRIASKILAKDFGWRYIDEFGILIDNQFLFQHVIKKGNVVIHCPSLSQSIHTFADVFVVFMWRKAQDIHKSERKLNASVGINMIREIEKYNEDPRKWRYDSQYVKKYYWRSQQKMRLKNRSIELIYEDLSSSDMWLDYNNRTQFGPNHLEGMEWSLVSDYVPQTPEEIERLQYTSSVLENLWVKQS